MYKILTFARFQARNNYIHEVLKNLNWLIEIKLSYTFMCADEDYVIVMAQNIVFWILKEL